MVEAACVCVLLHVMVYDTVLYMTIYAKTQFVHVTEDVFSRWHEKPNLISLP